MIQKLLLFVISLFFNFSPGNKSFIPSGKWICFFLLAFQMSFGQSCNVVKTGDFTGGVNATNWSAQTDLTGWYYSAAWAPNEAYIEADGVTNVSLKQSLTGLIGGPLTVSFNIKGQNANRVSTCYTTATLLVKLGGVTYLTVTNQGNNSNIPLSDVVVSNGASIASTAGFPLTVVGLSTAITQGTITLTIPWSPATAAATMADLEFVATTSNLTVGACVGAWGGDDWFLDNISLIAANPTSFNMTGTSVCAGSTATIGLNGSQLGVNYQLQLGGVNTGSPVSGTGSAISFGVQSTTGTYTVVATAGSTTCTTTMAGSVSISPNLPASVSIAASPSGAICYGTSVTFTATPTNGGTTPSYQWKLNGANVGTNSAAYTNAILLNSDIVSCEMTSNATPCLTGSPTTSNSITMTSGGPTTAGVNICTGGSGSLTSSTTCANGSNQTSGSNNARVGANNTSVGSIAWTSSGNITAVGTPYTTLFVTNNNAITNYLVGTDYNFSIPTNATIVGITALINRRADGGSITDNSVRILKGGVVSGTSQSSGATWNSTASLAVATFGSSSSLWGTTWTPADINNANFGVALSAISGTNNDRNLTVDYMQITVTYTVPGSIDWYTVASGGTIVQSGATFNPVNDPEVVALIPALANSNIANTYTFYAECSSNPGCRTPVTFVINASPTIAAISSPAALCSGSSLNPSVPTVTANGSTVTASGWQLETAVSSGAYANLSVPYTVAFADNGKRIRYYATNGCGTNNSNVVAIVVNQNPLVPTVGTITNVSCSAGGSVVLNDLPSGSWTINQSGTAITSYSSNTSSYTVLGLSAGSYTFTVTNASGCTSSATATIPITDASSTTWNGIAWSNGSPDATKNAIIVSVTPNSPFTADLSACALTINNSSGVATVPSGVTLTITNEVTVATDYNLIFENNASLVQINNATNTGKIIYKRNSAMMKNFDYTYWSSPVAGQTLFDLSPNTLADKYMSYSGTGWQISYGGTAVMQLGIGYIIRTPKGGTWLAPHPEVVAFPYSQPVQFKGVPNNGNITSSQSMVNGNLYLIGNPYPSALDADEFLFTNTNNHTVLSGTIYLWTHNTAVTNLKYSSNDYASYNGLGGVATSGGAVPSGYIAAGQSFFASAKANGNAAFDNSMRPTGNNIQFFKPTKTAKTATLEKHRLWLNITNTGGAFKQTLIGYAEGATNSYDDDFDGLTFDGNSYLDLYSINGTDNLTIQGRALPFVDTDVVPLGYRSTVAGSFTIAINQADGALATQRIYLEDKQTGTINELTAQNYTFSTAIGTFNNRFVLRYTNATLGTGDFETVENQITIVSQDKTITISSPTENLSKVFIYDVSGKQLYKKQNVDNVQLSIQHLPFAQQVLLVKVVLENGYTTTKKLIFK